VPLVEAVPVRQQVMVSRSFGREVTSYDSLQEALLTFLARAAEKLRAEGLAAQQLQLFVSSNAFRKDHVQYVGGRTVWLPAPSNDTLELATAAAAALRDCYRDGIRYKKAGVLLRGLVTTPLQQGSLLDDAGRRRRREQLNAALDALNRRYGSDTVRLAAELGVATVVTFSGCPGESEHSLRPDAAKAVTTVRRRASRVERAQQE
jgi:DNA polymerase V